MKRTIQGPLTWLKKYIIIDMVGYDMQKAGDHPSRLFP